MERSYNNFQERVTNAAERALKNNGSVGPLELFQEMGFLYPGHVQQWRKGSEFYPVIEEHIQCGQEKFTKAIQIFQEWAKQRGMKTVEASYTCRKLGGIQDLKITVDVDPDREKFYRTHYAPANLTPKKTARLEKKLNKAPDLVVFEKVSNDGECSECGVDLPKGSYVFMENEQPLCRTCADLDELVFLPSGDTALTRRARKYSTLAAVVVRFSRARKRYERQGLLVTEEALAKAEEECAADAPQRAEARARAAAERQEEDKDFIAAFAEAIAQRYPGCPAKETRQIAAHAGCRSSGRVGRSAAGRELDPSAVDLAVIAHIRHTHTEYDTLLMSGADRQGARTLVRKKIDEVREKWSAA